MKQPHAVLDIMLTKCYRMVVVCYVHDKNVQFCKISTLLSKIFMVEYSSSPVVLPTQA